MECVFEQLRAPTKQDKKTKTPTRTVSKDAFLKALDGKGTLSKNTCHSYICMSCMRKVCTQGFYNHMVEVHKLPKGDAGIQLIPLQKQQ